MTNRAAYRDEIERLLSDMGGDTYPAAIIHQGLRTALSYYSRQKGKASRSDITLTVAGKEIDISSLDPAPLMITRVWLPYTASTQTGEDRLFEHWQDDGILYISDYSPAIDQAVRIFYTVPRTVADLDGATETNIAPQDKAILLDGASAFAILAESTFGVDEVQIDSPTTRAEHLFNVAKWKLERFFAWLGLDSDGNPKEDIITEDGTGGITIKRLQHRDWYADEPLIPD